MHIHRKSVWLLVTLVLLMALTGCNFPGSDSGGGGSSQEELNPGSEPRQEEVAPETEPGQDDANPVPPANTEIPPLLPPDAERDACLDGNWIMPTSQLDLFVATMFPDASSFLRVTAGELRMSFVDGAYTYRGDYVLHVDSGPGMFSEADITFAAGGAYATEANSMITFDLGMTEAQTLTCTSYKDGQSFSTPCDGMGVTAILPPSTGPYRCSADRFELDVPSPSGIIITMFFER